MNIDNTSYPRKWTDDEVRDYFDAHWDTTVHELCAYSCRSKADVKRILMEQK